MPKRFRGGDSVARSIPLAAAKAVAAGSFQSTSRDFLLDRRVGAADVEAAGRHDEIRRIGDRDRPAEVDGRRAVHRVSQALQRDPASGESRHRDRQEEVGHDLLDAGGIEDRDA